MHRAGIAFLLGGLLLAPTACSSSSSLSQECRAAGTCPHGRTVFTYSCCRAGDVDVVHRAGTTLAVHWLVAVSRTTTRSPAASVRLAIDLVGPFDSVASAKRPDGGGTHTWHAATLRISDRAGGSPTSRISIPPQARAGYYDLRSSSTSVVGAVSGDSIVRIAGAG